MGQSPFGRRSGYDFRQLIISKRARIDGAESACTQISESLVLNREVVTL